MSKEQYYKDLYKNINDFIILNSYECYLNINTSNKKEYNNIYSKTPKRQEYLKNYYRLYKNKINNIEKRILFNAFNFWQYLEISGYFNIF